MSMYNMDDFRFKSKNNIKVDSVLSQLTAQFLELIVKVKSQRFKVY